MGRRGEELVGSAQGVAVMAAQGGGRDDAQPDFVADEDDVAETGRYRCRGQQMDEGRHLMRDDVFDVFLVVCGEQDVADPDRHAVDEQRVVRGACRMERGFQIGREMQRRFERCPMRGAFEAVARDTVRHLIVEGLAGGDEQDAVRGTISVVIGIRIGKGDSSRAFAGTNAS